MTELELKRITEGIMILIRFLVQEGSGAQTNAIEILNDANITKEELKKNYYDDFKEFNEIEFMDKWKEI